MDNNNSASVVSKEFLEKILNRKLKGFTIKPGTNVGDNYMSVLYAIEAKFESPGKDGAGSAHLLSKCFPSHPTRQEFLRKSNIFWNELCVYKLYIPALIKSAAESGLQVKLPFPPLVGGAAVDFLQAKRDEDRQYDGHVFGPFDIYIMMTDLRASGYRMASRLIGLDLDHVSLVMKAHAKYHALSWAYKQKEGLASIGSRFPFLIMEFSQEDRAMFNGVMRASAQTALDAVEKVVGKEAELALGLAAYRDNIVKLMDVWCEDVRDDADMGNFHRIRPARVQGEEQWRVTLHGDCWVNNMLFRYEDGSSRPSDVILVDLQMIREGCPTMDMAYFLYSSTEVDFRKKHLDDMLGLYHAEFSRYCGLLGVDCLPDFTLPELKRRFHRSKILGFFMASMVLPVMLKNAPEIIDMETMKKDANMGDMFNSLSDSIENNGKYNSRILALASELYAQGVL